MYLFFSCQAANRSATLQPGLLIAELPLLQSFCLLQSLLLLLAPLKADKATGEKPLTECNVATGVEAAQEGVSQLMHQELNLSS